MSDTNPSSALPVISIITVCYQAGATLEATIQSVIAQSWPAVEHIIVDGGSTDQTQQIIFKYRDHIAKSCSEKDEGLYDAMNKGLRMATGDYVFFLNADDLLFDKDTLRDAISRCPSADVLYGEAQFIDQKGNALGLRSERTPHQVPENLNWRSLRLGMVVSHQAFIVKRALAPEFDLQYKVCADIDWMIRCLKKTGCCCHTRLIISKFRIGGTSKQQQKKAWKERYAILAKHYGKTANFFNHLYIAGRYLLSKRY